MTRTCVIGHVNPNTDSTATVDYARLLRERDGEDVVATRTGPINPQICHRSGRSDGFVSTRSTSGSR